MDIVAHGLYGGAAFTRSRGSFFAAVWWGAFPDLIAFGFFFPIFVLTYGFHREQIMRVEPPTLDVIPHYVHQVYNLSHSLIVFGIIFCIVWIALRRPVYEMLAWALHIVMDIPSHGNAFFPTPFLYPLSSFHVNGIPWGTPWFFGTYWLVLLCIYAYIFFKKRYRVPTGLGDAGS